MIIQFLARKNARFLEQSLEKLSYRVQQNERLHLFFFVFLFKLHTYKKKDGDTRLVLN